MQNVVLTILRYFHKIRELISQQCLEFTIQQVENRNTTLEQSINRDKSTMIEGDELKIRQRVVQTLLNTVSCMRKIFNGCTVK